MAERTDDNAYQLRRDLGGRIQTLDERVLTALIKGMWANNRVDESGQGLIRQASIFGVCMNSV
jgi:hypothetical protein